MAMTAWAAKVCRSSICVCLKAPADRAPDGDGAERAPFAKERRHEGCPGRR